MHLPDTEVHAALEHLYRSGRFGGELGAGLATTIPDDHCSPGSVTEVIGASYDRVILASDSSAWAAAAGRAIQTIVASTWPAPLEDQGVILAIVLFDTTTKATGTPIVARRLSTGILVLAGGSPVVAAPGAIRIEAN